ncbi:hypothetical protein [Shinella sp. M31]|uniref:hypothetical protein n=1 Tax=Shinella sp. M31 TaxID=3368615 RepID=UPI003BA03DC1
MDFVHNCARLCVIVDRPADIVAHRFFDAEKTRFCRKKMQESAHWLLRPRSEQPDPSNA